MLMLGITVGIDLSVIFPYWLITVVVIILFIGTSSRSMFRGVQMWKQETLLKVVSATATLVMVFSSSLSVPEFYFLKRFSIPYGKNTSNCSNACPHRNIHTYCSTQLATSSPSVLAGFWGQFVDNRLHLLLGHLRQCSDHGSCWHREIHFYDQAP
ncbi:hypothetical protein ZIOFF_013094 [Zingiber officinale]|uniref:Uncharacterized protein n=1 Tax=Zingiber officinale TaxID=94328 RepID=A0A8J5HB79_ZINOF|nr:hypothetical protein ZIOFF_013094 [Zingiber officinale]